MKTSIKNIKLTSGQLPGGDLLLSGIAKRTYTIDKNGECLYAPEQLGLIDEPQYYPDNEDLLARDVDMYAAKQLSDVVVKGAIQLAPRQPFTTAEIRIGNHATAILGIGDRRAYLDLNQQLRFTPAQDRKEIPLRYDYAYGGNDAQAFKKNVPPLSEETLKLLPDDTDWSTANPYRYPRNPFGKGYMVELDHKTFGEVDLPNLEDPSNRLSPDRFFAKAAGLWHTMPVPQATDWVNYEAFPRINYFGFQHFFTGSPLESEEVVRGWAPPEVFSEPQSELIPQLTAKATNGASLGLQLPYLRPDAVVHLKNIYPGSSNFSLKLPNDIPSIWVDGRNGRLIETKPKIYTLEIDLHLNLVSILWVGHSKALRLYYEEELDEMPIKVEWGKN